MKSFLVALGGIALLLVAEFVGAAFFWFLYGRPGTYWGEVEKGSVFRNELVGGAILAVLFYIILELLGKL
jgi:hypothetical protein